MNPMLAAALGSIVRHILTYGAGYLVARGVWTGGESTAYVEAASLFLLGQGWSLYQKWDTHKALRFLRHSLALLHANRPPAWPVPPIPPAAAGAIVLVLILPGAARAQEMIPAPSRGERLGAEIVSWGSSAAAIEEDFRACRLAAAGDEQRCYIMTAVRHAAIFGGAQGIKAVTRRARPCVPVDCGSSNPFADVPSEHVAHVFGAMPHGGTGPRFSVVFSLGMVTAWGRREALEHDLIGVLAGGLLGYGVSFLR